MTMPKNYYNYFDICKMEGINPNTAKSAVGKDGVDGISSIVALKPIAHLFRTFPKGMRKQYGILRRHYDTWKQTGYIPKKNTGRPPRWKNDPTFTKLDMPIKKHLWDRFKRMVDNANAVSAMRITYRDMVYVALEEAMQRRPEFCGEVESLSDSPQTLGGGINARKE